MPNGLLAPTTSNSNSGVVAPETATDSLSTETPTDEKGIAPSDNVVNDEASTFVLGPTEIGLIAAGIGLGLLVCAAVVMLVVCKSRRKDDEQLVTPTPVMTPVLNSSMWQSARNDFDQLPTAGYSNSFPFRGEFPATGYHTLPRSDPYAPAPYQIGNI